MSRIDPVTGAVIQGALESIALEMGHKLMRMSYSSIIRESEDFGAALTDAERSGLQAHARTICSNWERVIAEAVFKYAGSVYADIEKLKTNSGDVKAYRNYVKHWGELKGFALSLHTGKFSLGSLGTELDALIGYGPVLMNGTQVSGLDAKGAYQMADASVDGYMVNMLKVQNLMVEEFGVVAKNNDKLAGISNLAEALGLANSAEND